MNVLAMSKQFQKRPSEILNICDEYTAYCFDEACMLIIAKLEDKQTPNWKNDGGENKNGAVKHYSGVQDFFNAMSKI